MKLVDILNALHDELENAKKPELLNTEKLNQTYLTLSARYDQILGYKISEDTTVPGLSINDIKREIKSSRNTFYSVISGLLDEEINKARFCSELTKLSLKASELADTASAAYLKASMIAFISKVPTEDKTIIAEPITVEAAAPPTDTKSAYRNINEMRREIEESDYAEKKAEDSEIEWLRKHQAAPTTPEGWRALQQKAQPDFDTVKKINTQDEEQRQTLQEYQEALQKLAETTPSSNVNWVIGKGPIFFSSQPPIREYQIKALKYKYNAFFPGWILGDQYLLGIKPSLLKDRKELLTTLRYIKKTLSQRFPCGFVYMVLPTINKNINLAAEKDLADDSEEGKEKRNKLQIDQYKKKKDKEKEKLDRSQLSKDALVEVPKFIGLPGSKLVWTWLLLENRYNTIPRIKVRDFGFPTASSMRNLDERMAKSIIPDLKHDALQVDEIAKQYRHLIDKEYAETSAPLNAKIEENKEKKKTVENTLKDLTVTLKGAEIALEETKHNLALAATSTLREKLTALLKTQENRVDAITGQINGYRSIVKQLTLESQSLSAQKTAMLSQIRQKAAEDMRKAKQGVAPDDQYAIK